MIALFRKPTGLLRNVSRWAEIDGTGVKARRMFPHAGAQPVSTFLQLISLGGGPGLVEYALRQEIFDPCGISDRLVVGRSEYLVLLIE